MQPPQFILCLRNSKTQKFEYKRDVESVSRQGKLYAVAFKNDKTYFYGEDKVRYYPLLSTRENVRIYVDGVQQGGVDRLYDYGLLYIFASENHIANPIPKRGNIEICDAKESLDNTLLTLEYFKTIVSKVATSFAADVTPEDGRSISQIGAEMVVKALEEIDPKEIRTVFSNYIDGIAPTPINYGKSIIFPFGCNESQQSAVKAAMTNTMSIIEGPPGTGKTQTILNIIANIISNNQRVAVVSNNNSAVKNVEEKLSKGGYGSIVASLGNTENRTAFFTKPQYIDRFKQHQLPEEQTSQIATQITALSTELTECFQKRNRVALLKSQLTEAESEQKHLYSEQPLSIERYTEIDRLFHRKSAIDNPVALRKLLSKGKLSIIDRLILFFGYGCYDILHIDDYIESLPIYANYRFYELHIASIKKEIDELENWLQSIDDESKLATLIEMSSKLFGATLSVKYDQLEEAEFDINNYKKQFREFIKRYPIVTSSTLSLHTSVLKDFLFDYLIIDESSQVDIIKASICFAYARRVVIVGDSCQLSHIVDRDSAEITEELHSKYNIAPAYNYATMNILDSLKALYGSKIPTTMLREHYRCHPDIIGFCNKRYYNDELVVMTKREEDNISPFTIIETSIGGSQGKYNQRQIDETERYIVDHFADDYSRVGVVSPYRNHADMLQALLPKGCEADTIHKYQGREKDVIIFNSVANSINSFIDNPNLINVAVSRATKGFVMVKPKSMELPHGTNIGDLIRYICYNYTPEQVTQSGSICSVFDLLYKEYNRLYITCASKNRAIGGSPAEVIIHKLLEKLLQEPCYASIDFVREYYLRDLTREISLFSEGEREYIRHGSRLDFLLYNKIDRCPILAIEVDGVTFHKNEKQQARDAMKNSILDKLQLPLLRLSTDGHSERKRIEESLQGAMNLQT